ncbi:WD40/YVTN/BNR-like repeat-containing protein [Aquabacterium sp.]|uniref:WD40/YVTN/BNR-like repeat-containing protein n=1 Tax=Aquabacterium sp. TaxID=1872578 RepID=UPI002B9F476E|nr:YCF48-related protein [Aquabacterium sp.]HSW07315.1 YCF48-related protein [Aquabacterium sp.]
MIWRVMRSRLVAALVGVSLVSLALRSPVFAAEATKPAALVPAAEPASKAAGLVPAVRVAHATQATMLAATRAGARIVAVGDHGVVLLSDDGGKSFRQAQQVPVDVTLTAVSFADAQQGWAVGHAGVVLHTADGGETWALQRSDLQNDRPLFAVKFFDAKRGVAVGLWSLVLVTDDGGVTWQTVQPPVPEGAKKADLNLLGLFTDAQGRVYATAERGMLARSDDQGRSWTYLRSGYAGSFWTGLGLADGTLLAAGLRGSLYCSSDEGRSWTRIETNSKSSITALAQVGSEVIAVGLDGLVLRSTDGGASFKTELRADRVSLTALSTGADGRPLLFSRQGLVAAGESRK